MGAPLGLIRARKAELIERAELAIELEETGEVSPGELRMIAAELEFLLKLVEAVAGVPSDGAG